MSKSGSPRTTMTSASLPGSIVPRSFPRPRITALTRVAAPIARCGDMPVSTWALISRQRASVWKFIGVPESVPMPIVTLASIHCAERAPSPSAFPGRSSRSTRGAWKFLKELWTSLQICGPEVLLAARVLEPLGEGDRRREEEGPVGRRHDDGRPLGRDRVDERRVVAAACRPSPTCWRTSMPASKRVLARRPDRRRGRGPGACAGARRRRSPCSARA